MSHISDQAARAFLNRNPYKQYNTQVTEVDGDLILTVENKVIARRKHSLGFDDRFGLDIEIACTNEKPKTIASRLFALILQLPLPMAVGCIKGKVNVISSRAGMPSEKSRHYKLTTKLTYLREIIQHFENLREQSRNQND